MTRVHPGDCYEPDRPMDLTIQNKEDGSSAADAQRSEADLKFLAVSLGEETAGGWYRELPDAQIEVLSRAQLERVSLDAAEVRVVGRVAVPSELEPFPIFRSGMVDPPTRKVAVWWLWDGTKEWRIGSLEPAQRALPIRGVWNDTALRQRIESGWTPETDAST
jgi:hypothetical protein